MSEQLPRGYSLTRKLASGSAGTVYVGKQVSLDRTVALKRIPVSVDLDATARTELLTEARALALLRSPNVIAIYDIGFTPAAAWLVTQYVEGQDLQSIIEAHPQIPSEIAQRWILQICRALSDASKKGITHRDVKPANILIDTEGNALLADFGVADIRRSVENNATGNALGTPAYMAPEQIRGEATDANLDLCSTALIAYQLLVGKHPFLPNAKNLESLYEAQLHQPALADAPANLNRATRKCLAQALEKDPAERQQNTQIFGEQLERSFTGGRRGSRFRGWVWLVVTGCSIGVVLGLAFGLLLNR